MLSTTSVFKQYVVCAIDGDIGSIEDLYFDDQNWAIRYFVADTGSWLFGRKVLDKATQTNRASGSIYFLPLTSSHTEAHVNFLIARGSGPFEKHSQRSEEDIRSSSPP
jgi:hypothetical protein